MCAPDADAEPLCAQKEDKMEKHLFTSESVTEGHPDKLCDAVSDAILDACMEQDPMSRVACETVSCTGFVMVTGEITTKANLDIPTIVRQTVNEIGYNDAKTGFDCHTCAVMVALDKQSPDIAMGVDKALEARESVSEAVAGENITITSFPATDYASVSELRSGIVEFAKQYLGNKYVHGGSSLEKGTDCSGFTSLIYAQFGYSISRTPSGQLANDGKSISYDSIQPGDIICYGSSGKCTHVALYIGDGQIIHSANSRKGVIINNADYDTILGIKSVID